MRRIKRKGETYLKECIPGFQHTFLCLKLTFGVAITVKSTRGHGINCLRTFMWSQRGAVIISRWWPCWMTASLLVRIQEEITEGKNRYHVSPSWFLCLCVCAHFSAACFLRLKCRSIRTQKNEVIQRVTKWHAKQEEAASNHSLALLNKSDWVKTITTQFAVTW